MFKSAIFGAGLFLIACDVFGAPRDASCPLLKLKFGRIRYRQRGRLVKFVCNTGYVIAGEKYSTCKNGTWDDPPPKCVRASCNQVSPPINGLIYPAYRGAVLNFFCKPGFDLHGPHTTYCDGHNWDNKLPACIPSNTKPLLSCDFETEDLCGWNHDVRHDFDWRRMNFKTPSGHLGTGPSHDHTKGTGENGYYMYIESSSRNENDTARLISPVFEAMNTTDVCLQFYYHMHGSTTGQLRVYLKKESDDWSFDAATESIFWKMGNHGDRWIQSLTHLGPVDEDFQIVIEGVRGSSYFSDIAVDDVRIIADCTDFDEPDTSSTPYEGLTYSEAYEPFQSCSNRCDVEDNLIVRPTTTNNNNLIGCDCDETCRDRFTCCPDYAAICILGVTDDFSAATDDFSTQPEAAASTEETGTTATTLQVKTASFVPKMSRRPTLIFLSPSTPQVFVRKTNAAVTVAVTTVTTTTNQQIDELSKSSPQTFIDDYNEVIPITSTDDDDDDDNEIPPHVNEETATPWDYKARNQERIVKDTTSTVQESNVKFVVIAAVVSVMSVLSIVLIVAVVARRNRYLNCRSITGMNSNGDSQSDVRFLTGDEILDFNVAHPEY